jgi:hypothetical protein
MHERQRAIGRYSTRVHRLTVIKYSVAQSVTEHIHTHTYIYINIPTHTNTYTPTPTHPHLCEAKADKSLLVAAGVAAVVPSIALALSPHHLDPVQLTVILRVKQTKVPTLVDEHLEHGLRPSLEVWLPCHNGTGAAIVTLSGLVAILAALAVCPHLHV